MNMATDRSNVILAACTLHNICLQFDDNSEGYTIEDSDRSAEENVPCAQNNQVLQLSRDKRAVIAAYLYNK